MLTLFYTDRREMLSQKVLAKTRKRKANMRDISGLKQFTKTIAERFFKSPTPPRTQVCSSCHSQRRVLQLTHTTSV